MTTAWNKEGIGVAISSNRVRSYRKPFSEPTEHFSANFPVSLMHWLRTQAAQRRVSLAKAAYDLLSAQRHVQEQLAAVFTLGPTTEGAIGHHILQVLLERVKDDIARSIDRQADQVVALREQLRTTQAMIDRAYYGFVLHTPRVPAERRTQAISDADERHRKFVEDVRLVLTPSSPKRGHHDHPHAQTTATGTAARQTSTGADANPPQRVGG